MPVEIKELHIKAIVAKPEQPQQVGFSATDIRNLKKEIKKECVQEILRQLKEKTDR